MFDIFLESFGGQVAVLGIEPRALWVWHTNPEVYPQLFHLFALHKVTMLLLQNLCEVLFLSFEQEAKNLETPGLDTCHL